MLDQRLADLIASLHTLASRDVKTLDDARAIERNASQSLGTRAAARLVLHVAGESASMPFDMNYTWGHWDQEQRDAFQTWLGGLFRER